MTSLSISRSPLPLRRRLSARMEFGITIVLAVTGVLVAVLSLLYLFYANAKATQDYHLRTLQERRTELVKKNEILAAEIAKTESLDALEQNKQIAAMGFSPQIYSLDTKIAAANTEVAKAEK